MSLVALAARLSLWKALQNATFAENRVYDSAITPIDLKSIEEKNPIIILSTDDDVSEVEGFNLLGGKREMDIIVEMAVSSAVETKDGQEIVIPHTDAGLEMTLNLMQRQVYRVLLASDDPFAVFFKGFIWKISKIQARRGADSEKGEKFAARQIIFTCDTLDEPAFGQPPAGIWADFILALKADAQLSQIGALIESELTGEVLPSWQEAKAQLGVNRQGLFALGLAPFDETAAEDPAALSEITIDAADSPEVTLSVP